MMQVTITKGAAIWMLVLLTALLIQPTPPAQADESHVTGTMVLAPTEGLDGSRERVPVLASGAAEDTLKACMARIPELASAGQHLLAEQGCTGEEETRNAIRSAPKF